MRTNPPINPGHQTLDGTVRLFAAESLALPTGLATLAFLTRWLGAERYGLYALVVTVVVTIEWIVASILGRAANKCIAEAREWEPVAARVARVYLLISLLIMLVLWALADLVARGLGEPQLAGYLRLLALDLPIFSLAQLHRNVLVSLGRYRPRAVLSAARWLVRVGLIVSFVAAGWSVNGAILGCIGTSLVELVWARRYVRVPLWGAAGWPEPRFWQLVRPLVVFVIGMRVFDKVDLFALKALGASAAQAGLYGAAQNLALMPALFGMAFAPLLQATLTRLLRDGQRDHARAMARDALRLVLLLLPFGALVGGVAPALVRLISGPEFVAAAPLVSRLVFAALGVIVVTTSTSILVAAEHPRWTMAVAGPMAGLAVIGQLLVIPRWGATGAATVTLVCAWLGAALALGAVWHHLQVFPRWPSLLRSLGLSVAAYALMLAWPVVGAWVLLALLLGAGLVVGAYLLLGEFDARERALAWSLIPWTPTSRS